MNKEDKLLLQKASLRDIEIVQKLMDQDSAKYLHEINWPFTLKDAKKWILNLTKNNSNLFLIKNEQDFVGLIWIEKINIKDNSGEIGFIVNKNFQGKGYGYEASQLLINFAFNKLKLLKLTALTTNYNISSQRLLKKLRFKIVKRMKRDYFDKKLNKWCDVLEYRL